MSETRDEHLLDHAKSPYHRGSLADASHGHVERSLLCGDEVQLQLRIDGPTVSAAWFQGRGCLVSQAAASILCSQIDGGPLVEAAQATEQDMLDWIGIPLSPSRRVCGLLAFRALQHILSVSASSQANEH